MTTGLVLRVRPYRCPFSRASFGTHSPSEKGNCWRLAGTVGITSMMYVRVTSDPSYSDLYIPRKKFYIGRELNPTVASLDIKSFNELRPGIILWLLIDISMACTQATQLGGRITDSMVLVLLFQGLYIMDALYNEVGLPGPTIFSTVAQLPSLARCPYNY
jgi:hypothetical protein